MDNDKAIYARHNIAISGYDNGDMDLHYILESFGRSILFPEICV